MAAEHEVFSRDLALLFLAGGVLAFKTVLDVPLPLGGAVSHEATRRLLLGADERRVHVLPRHVQALGVPADHVQLVVPMDQVDEDADVVRRLDDTDIAALRRRIGTR